MTPCLKALGTLAINGAEIYDGFHPMRLARCLAGFAVFTKLLERPVPKPKQRLI